MSLRASWLIRHSLIRSRLQLPHSRPPFPRRQFQSSRPNHILSQTTLDYASNTFEYIHTLSGLPWALSIPLTAILFRTAFSLPIYYAYFRNQRNRHNISQLQEAYRNALNIQAKAEAEQKGETPPPPIEKVKLGGNSKVWILFSKTLKPKRDVRMLPLLFAPIWLESLDALLYMSGRVGDILPSTAQSTAILNTPALASEELSWFPDLTVANPTLCALFATLCLTNLFLGVSQGFIFTNASPFPHPWPRLRPWIFRTAAFLFAAPVGVVMHYLHIPAAVLLFCVSSSLYALVTRSVIRRLVGGHQNVILPARARTVGQRWKLWNDDRKPRRYRKSKSVPSEWEDLFLEKQLRAESSARSIAAAAPPKPSRYR